MKEVFRDLEERLRKNPPPLNLDQDATNLRNPYKLMMDWDSVGIPKEIQHQMLKSRGIKFPL